MSDVAWVGDATGIGRVVDGPALSVRDRGLTVGYGLFETMRALPDGRLPLWERHIARMSASARTLGLPAPPVDRLRAAAAVLLERADRGHGVLRVTLTAGDGEARIAMTTRALDSLDWPLRVATVAVGRGDRDPTAAHKTTSRLFWVVAQRAAESAGADEALVHDDAGALAETTNGNLFVELDGVWVTPPADGRILPGVARSVLLDGLRAAAVPADERPILAGDLARGRRVAVTNAVHGPRPAIVDGRAGGGAVPELSKIWTAALAP